jgi:hypothetical protein
MAVGPFLGERSVVLVGDDEESTARSTRTQGKPSDTSNRLQLLSAVHRERVSSSLARL